MGDKHSWAGWLAYTGSSGDHLRRARDELDGAVHKPSREEIEPPTDREVEASRATLRRWAEEDRLHERRDDHA